MNLCLVDQRLHGGRRRIHQVGDIKGGGLHVHAPGFDFRDIQDRVDQRQQVVGADQDLVQILDLFLRQRLAALTPDDTRKADDGVERRAYLVAHTGQKRTLGMAGSLGLGARLLGLLEQPSAFPVFLLEKLVGARQLAIDRLA